MYKYILGSVIVFIIAYYAVDYGMHHTAMQNKIDEAMDVSHGEYTSMGIKKADRDEDGWVLYLDDMRLYASRIGKGTMCTATGAKIYFPTNKNAKLVMKLRYNIGPLLAKPLRKLTPEQAMMPAAKDEMIKSLKEGYANQYGIKTMTKVEINGLSCKEMK